MGTQEGELAALKQFNRRERPSLENITGGKEIERFKIGNDQLVIVKDPKCPGQVVCKYACYSKSNLADNLLIVTAEWDVALQSLLKENSPQGHHPFFNNYNIVVYISGDRSINCSLMQPVDFDHFKAMAVGLICKERRYNINTEITDYKSKKLGTKLYDFIRTIMLTVLGLAVFYLVYLEAKY
ncbi:MAG: hypothetical protein GY814_05130 [Gammaproteobacteria bacterium]|nr:hypothetical protein [Gammaproteobacteria bacterium]